ncbi:MAG: UDP-N-acetylmuramoyl-L-alanine--D-glutamate ligase [Clostridiales bacterium]|nr:UDP-N-acetylmuramoyl-L-alanine--D-glutamate ligase [Clostridiales bacterium]
MSKLTGYAEKVKGKRVTFIGMGISNMKAVEFFSNLGVEMTARDKNPDPTYTPYGEGGEVVRVEPILKGNGVKCIFGDNYLNDLSEDIIVKTPGIRPDLEEFKSAVEKGSVLTSEIEIVCELCPCKIFAVTGSDGKTTTTTLISKILEKQCEETGGIVYLGGNIGTPLICELENMKSGDMVVLELSSFQLMTMRFSPYSSVITNITPNHLNWHIDMEEYVLSKENIVVNQSSDCYATLNAEDPNTHEIIKKTRAKVTFFSSRGEVDAESCVYYENGDILYKCGGCLEKVMSDSQIFLRGTHNIENVMAAYSATKNVVSKENFIRAVEEFRGVRHRIEFVCEKNGVKYYNSSIDTTPTRSMAALKSFEEPLIVICGGSDKNIPYDPMIDLLCEKSRFIVTTGKTGVTIRNLLEKKGISQNQYTYVEDFDSAVKEAEKHALPGDVVLLSPASASFDSFRNFEVRGNRFCELVRKNTTEGD